MPGKEAPAVGAGYGSLGDHAAAPARPHSTTPPPRSRSPCSQSMALPVAAQCGHGVGVTASGVKQQRVTNGRRRPDPWRREHLGAGATSLATRGYEGALVGPAPSVGVETRFWWWLSDKHGHLYGSDDGSFSAPHEIASGGLSGSSETETAHLKPAGLWQSHNFLRRRMFVGQPR